MAGQELHYLISIAMEEEVKKPVEIEPIEWETESFETHQRGWSWYVLVIVILLAALAYTIYLHRWVLTGVTVMVGVVLYLSGRLRSERIKCRIDGQGIAVGERVFPYEQLKTFWISQSASQLKLNLITTFRFMPVISVMITAELMDRLRQTLGGKLPEAPNRGEDWIDRINRWLKI
jgi:hypothetical protein